MLIATCRTPGKKSTLFLNNPLFPLSRELKNKILRKMEKGRREGEVGGGGRGRNAVTRQFLHNLEPEKRGREDALVLDCANSTVIVSYVRDC